MRSVVSSVEPIVTIIAKIKPKIAYFCFPIIAMIEKSKAHTPNKIPFVNNPIVPKTIDIRTRCFNTLERYLLYLNNSCNS